MAGRTPWAGPGGFGDDVLVGRAVERNLLDRAAEHVQANTPQLVVVEGRPGVGKSALVRAFAAARGDEFVVLWARGEEIERHLDFGITDQLVREAAATGLDTPPALARSDSRPDPLEIGDTLLGLVEAHTVGRPLLVIVDDAQWADIASLQALSFAFRRVHDRPVLLIVVQRPGATALESFHRLVRDGRGQRLRLSGLSVTTLRQLVARRVGIEITARAAERLHEHTAGNPLESLTLAEELDPAVLASGFGPLPAPRSYASLVLSRLAQCSPQAEGLVAAVAVLGRPTDTSILARMLDTDDLAVALSEAVDRGLVHLEFRSGWRRVDVDHPLLRAAVLADLSPTRHAELQRRAAAVTTDPDRAFMHRLRAVVGEDAELAEEAIARARLRLAAGWELSAIELLVAAAGLLADDTRRAEALLIAADRLLDAGDATAADELLEAVPQGVGGALEHLVRGQRALLGGDPMRARDQLRRAWDSDPSAEVAARAAGLLATIAANAGRAEPALTWSRRALRLGEGSDRGPAMTMLASAWALRGDLAAGLDEVDDWYHALAGPAGRADALLARGVLRLWDGRHDEAVEAFAAVTEPSAAVAAGPLLVTATARYALADAAYRQGRWDEALEMAEHLTVTLDDAGMCLAGPMAHGVASFVLGGRGETDAANAHLAAGRRALQASGAASGGLWLEVGAARVSMAAGAYDDVAARLGVLAELLRSTDLPEGVQPWQADLVEALVAVGRLDDAVRELTDLGRRVSGGGPHVRAGVARAAGLLAAARGDDDDASATFDDALADDATATGGFARGRLELAAGAFHRRAGRRRAAAALLSAAQGRFDALGAVPYGLRAAHELDSCGLTPRRRGDADTQALTRAETSVAELVAAGRTNREVAAHLVVSVKTVESHLARIFTKLGVRSRTELANRWRNDATSSS